MASSSLGTPGVVNTKQSLTLMANPNALPKGLWMSWQPAGTKACLRFAGLGSIRRRAHQFSTWARASGFSVSSVSVRVAITSLVRSSRVGPRPPLTMTAGYCCARRARALCSNVGSSPTVHFSAISSPWSPRQVAIMAELLSTVSPDISSLPVSSKAMQGVSMVMSPQGTQG